MNRFPRALTAAVVVVILVLLTGGVRFYRAQERQLRQQVEGELAAIARLKVDQIGAWRAERLDEGAELMERPLLRRLLVQWLINPRAGDRETVLAEFRVMQRHDDYADVLLVDPDSRVRLSLSGRTRTHEDAAQALAAVLRDGRPVLTELHAESDDPRPHIAVVAPLFAGDGQARRPLGAVILVTDARQFLYPLIQSWPTPSRTAETLLVRRDGDHVLYLNDLRHQAGTALKLRIPLNRTDLPAVRAVLGKEGVVEGLDYRGVEVVSVLRAIPNSPWFMVAKVDAAEAFATWRSRSALILLLLLGFMGCVGAAGLVIWQRREKAHYRALYWAEAARRQSEERHRITLMSVGDGVIATDAEGRVEIVNPVAQTLTGWAITDAYGKPLDEIFRIVNEDTRQPVESPVARVLREGTVVGLANHTMLVARDGTERPIADSGAPIRGEDGSLTGVVLVFRDQTEERLVRRLVETRLSLIEYAVHHTLDELLTRALDEVGAFVDSPIGFYHFVEPDQKTVSLQQWSTRTLKEFCQAEGKGMHYGIDQAGVWVDCVYERKPVIHNDYALLPHKKGMPDGHAKVIRELVVPVMWEDKVVAILGVGNKPTEYTQKDVEIVSHLADVTWEIVRQKQAEAALRQSEEQFRAMFEMASIGMAQADVRSGQWLRVNDKLCEITGYSADEMLALRVPEITHPDDRERDWQAFERVVRGEAPDYRMEKRYVRKDGRLAWVNVNMTVIRGADGQPVRTMATIEDITERKRLEQEHVALEAQLRQQQKLEAIGTLAGGVAHEINNPINGIMNYAQLIADTAAPESRAAEYAGEILAETARVATIVRNLLQFARQEPQAHSPARIADIVEQTISLLRAVFRRDQIALDVDVPADLPPIKCQSQQIQQVVMNLLTNARDGLNAKYPGYHEAKTLAVRVAPFEREGRRWLRLTVADRGPGIPPEIQARIFDPFFTTKPRDKGSGLGLSISHGIAKDHHGVLHFETVPGQGTQFHLDLPVEEGE